MRYEGIEIIKCSRRRFHIPTSKIRGLSTTWCSEIGGQPTLHRLDRPSCTQCSIAYLGPPRLHCNSSEDPSAMQGLEFHVRVAWVGYMWQKRMWVLSNSQLWCSIAKSQGFRAGLENARFCTRWVLPVESTTPFHGDTRFGQSRMLTDAIRFIFYV